VEIGGEVTIWCIQGDDCALPPKSMFRLLLIGLAEVVSLVWRPCMARPMAACGLSRWHGDLVWPSVERSRCAVMIRKYAAPWPWGILSGAGRSLTRLE
jgi:hypothetical protein